MGLSITEPAATEPLTLVEAKAHLRVDSTDEDALISSLITAATEYAQGATNRRLIDTAFAYTLDSFPSTGVIVLPETPLIAVQSITYVDTNGDTQTWSNSLYDVKTDTLLGTVRPAYGEDFPSTREQQDAVTVSFTAGYADASSVPEAIKSGMKLMIGHLYEQRESYVVGTIIAGVPSADMLFDLNRIVGVH